MESQNDFHVHQAREDFPFTSDFSFSRPGRATFVLLLYLGHIGNLTGMNYNLSRTTKVTFLLSYTIPEECLADQGQAFRRMSAPFT